MRPTKYEVLDKRPKDGVKVADYSRSKGFCSTWAITTYDRAMERGHFPRLVAPFKIFTVKNEEGNLTYRNYVVEDAAPIIG